MKGNFHVQFLGEGVAATSPPYPTLGGRPPRSTRPGIPTRKDALTPEFRKGNGIYWTEDNAEAVFQLRAAVVSGRWEEIVEHTREAMARDRRTDWRWTPPECLAELKELDEEYDDVTQTSTRKQSKRSAA